MGAAASQGNGNETQELKRFGYTRSRDPEELAATEELSRRLAGFQVAQIPQSPQSCSSFSLGSQLSQGDSPPKRALVRERDFGPSPELNVAESWSDVAREAKHQSPRKCVADGEVEQMEKVLCKKASSRLGLANATAEVASTQASPEDDRRQQHVLRSLENAFEVAAQQFRDELRQESVMLVTPHSMVLHSGAKKAFPRKYWPAEIPSLLRGETVDIDQACSAIMTLRPAERELLQRKGSARNSRSQVC